MTVKFDPTKPVQTRDGRKARIICTDRKSTVYPLVGLILNGETEYLTEWDLNGKHRSNGFFDSVNDLINIPERTSRWVNVYDGSDWCYGFETESDAREHSTKCRRGTVEIIFEDGKPVDVKLHRDEKRTTALTRQSCSGH